jgi:hypothetical protein
MKKLITIAFLIIFSNAQAQLCTTIDLEAEQQKLGTFVTFSDTQIDQFMELKGKVKRAQVMSCLDKILSGQEIEFSKDDKIFALEILKDLEDKNSDTELKENIDFLNSYLI